MMQAPVLVLTVRSFLCRFSPSDGVLSHYWNKADRVDSAASCVLEKEHQDALPIVVVHLFMSRSASVAPMRAAAPMHRCEPTNAIDVMAAMASRESGCVTVTEVYALHDPVPHVQFYVLSDPPSGGILTWTNAAHRFPASEIYPHPRRGEVLLRFAELTTEHPQYEQVRANRDSIAACFQSVL
jgi:hypothetical protein